ncbi:MAG: ABC transporter substrate-binding protein, partial [Agromyces sp.]
MNTRITGGFIIGALVLTSLGLSACSSGPSSAIEDHLDGRGPITYVQGKDNNGIVAGIIDAWNADHPNEKVTLKEQSDSAN